MTEQEWYGGVAPLLENWWPGEWTQTKSAAYRMAVGHFPLAAVTEALERHMQAGAKFRPSAGEVHAMLAGSATQRPGPEEAWALIEQAVRRVGTSVYAQDFAERHQAAIDWLAEQDEVVAAFAARRGLCGEGSLGHEPVNDGEFGGAVRARIAKDYREALTAAADREARGLPPVPAGALTVRGTGQAGGGMGELIERLRPDEQAALPAGESGDA